MELFFAFNSASFGLSSLTTVVQSFTSRKELHTIYPTDLFSTACGDDKHNMGYIKRDVDRRRAVVMNSMAGWYRLEDCTTSLSIPSDFFKNPEA